MLQCLIIDDEKDARDALRILVKKFVQNADVNHEIKFQEIKIFLGFHRENKFREYFWSRKFLTLRYQN